MWNLKVTVLIVKAPLEDSDGDELALPVEESLVIRRTLQVQTKEDDTNEQRLCGKTKETT